MIDVQFFIRDTCSSNGTFINNSRLSAANEDSPAKEVYSNDIIQFGVEVVDSTSKKSHGCIILRIKLYYPNGSEAFKTSSIFKTIPTANMLPPYYSYIQMVEREKEIFTKLNIIESVLDEANALADICWQAKLDEQKLVCRLKELQNTCDEKIKVANEMIKVADELRDQLEIRNNLVAKLQKKLKEDINTQVFHLYFFVGLWISIFLISCTWQDIF